MPLSRFTSPFAISAVVFILVLAPPSIKPTDAELAKITERGALLAEYDKVAGAATDALKSAHPVESRLRLFIARETETGWVVDFGRLNEAQNKFLVAYEAALVGKTSKLDVRSFDPVKEETGWNLAAAKGIEAALKDFGRTRRPYNVAVLPAERDCIYVYLYPAQLETGPYLLGADVRYYMTGDGTKIIDKRQMHKTIIASIPAKPGVKVTVGYHTHVLSDLPEDTDVMLVLARKPLVPEIVVAGDYMFTINVDGRISVEDLPR